MGAADGLPDGATVGRRGVPAEVLDRLTGAVARPFQKPTRRAFGLHVLDELVHHGAEAAVPRDLHAAR